MLDLEHPLLARFFFERVVPPPDLSHPSNRYDHGCPSVVPANAAVARLPETVACVDSTTVAAPAAEYAP